jgi:hypothetical protein
VQVLPKSVVVEVRVFDRARCSLLDRQSSDVGLKMDPPQGALCCRLRMEGWRRIDVVVVAGLRCDVDWSRRCG